MLKREATKILKARAKELKVSQADLSKDVTLHVDYFFILEFGEHLLALREQDVDEIHDELRITPLPNTKEQLLGVINVRGRIVSIIDLHAYLNMRADSHFERAKAKTVIVDMGEFASGILVSDVLEKITVEKDLVEHIKSDSADSEYITSVIPFADQKVGVLDIRRILNLEELIINHG